MNYEEFANNIKAKYPQYQDMDNMELAKKMVAKYPQYNDVTFDNIQVKKNIFDLPQKEAMKQINENPKEALKNIQKNINDPIIDNFKGYLQGFSKLGIGLGKTIGNKYLRPLVGKQPLSKEQMDNLYGFLDNEPKGLGKVTSFAGETLPYMLLPAANAFKGAGLASKVGNVGLTGAYQGGVIGGLESLKNEGDLSGVVPGAVVGGAIGGAIPMAGAVGNKIRVGMENPRFQNAVSKTLDFLTSVPDKYSKLALQKEFAGKSIFKGKFDADTAYRPVEQKLREAKNKIPNSDYYNNEYKKIGAEAKQEIAKKLVPDEQLAAEYNKLGERYLENIENYKSELGKNVDTAIQNLPEDKTIEAYKLYGDLDDVFNSSSISLNNNLNVAQNQAGKTYKEIQNLIDQARKPQAQIDKENFAKLYEDTVAGRLDPTKQIDILSETPQVWLNQGLPNNKIVTNQNILKKMGSEPNKYNQNHYLEPDIIKDLPELLNNPQAILKSSSQPGRYVGVLDAVDNQNKQVLGIINPDGGVNFVPSAYGRNNFAEFMQNQENLGNILYKRGGTSSTPTIGVEQSTPITSIADLPQKSNITPKQLEDILRNIKEQTTWGKPGTELQNSILERLYGTYSGRLAELSPELAAANKAYSNLMGNISKAGGLNSNTIATKLKNIGSETQIRSGVDTALKELDSSLPQNYKKIMEDVNYLKNIENTQAQLQNDISDSLYNNFSRFNNAGLATQNAFEKMAPKQVTKYKNLLEQQKADNELMQIIGGRQYERNPRLLGNRTDEGFENALQTLQDRSGINFMDDLEAIRAREALENLLPGQGGGSGSAQGFGNLLRTAILGASPTTALITKKPAALAGLAVISPKLMAKGTIKNLGRVYNLLGEEIPQEIQRLITPAAVEFSSPMLYGGVQYYE